MIHCVLMTSTTMIISLLSTLSKQYSLSQYWKQWIKALLLRILHSIPGKNTNMYKGSWKKVHISQHDFYNHSREFEKEHSEKNSPFFIIFILGHILWDTWNENSDLELSEKPSVPNFISDMTQRCDKHLLKVKGCLCIVISSVRIEEVLVRMT